VAKRHPRPDPGLSDRDRQLLQSIRAAANDGGRHPEIHDPRFASVVEGRRGANRGCETKCKFSKPAHAQKAARDCAEKYGDYFGFYHCIFCGQYHLTTSHGTPNGA
jgi:hypothetical protein